MSDTPRLNGKFAKAVCVNAHDRCFLGGPCPYCELRTKLKQNAWPQYGLHGPDDFGGVHSETRP